MTRRHFLIATTAVAASVGIIACDGRSSPTAPSSTSSAVNLARRSNVLSVTKDCSEYTAGAGDFCTITSSNVNAIKVGSRVVYASGADANFYLDTDIVIDPRGGGEQTTFGHCSLDLLTGDGECRLWGGKGRFEDFSATVIVSHLDGPNYAWDGTYSVGSGRD